MSKHALEWNPNSDKPKLKRTHHREHREHQSPFHYTLAGRENLLLRGVRL